MNVARVCRLIPSALPHEYLGFQKNSLEGMFVTIGLLGRVMDEEREQNDNAKDNKSSSTSAQRIAKHMRNR